MYRQMEEKQRSRAYTPNEQNIWKEFNCPEYVIRTCSKSDKLPAKYFGTDQSQLSVEHTLEKLQKLISDTITSDSVPRICRLLYEYLHEIGNEGYKVKHLPEVMKILEFLALKVKSVKEYQVHLDKMLDLCNLPPLLEKTSESLVSSDIMEQYFTLLGYLLAILPTKQQVMKIHKALHSLLIRTKPTNIAAVKLDYCRCVMEKSRLALTITEILEASFPDMYPKILELVFLLVSVSHVCCHKMLEAGILNTLLIRMDLPYATQLRCTKPPDITLDGNEYSQNTTFLIMNVLCGLMKSIAPPKQLPDNLKNLSAPQCAMCWITQCRGLRYALKRQTYYGQHNIFNRKIRNEIVMFILTGLVTFSSWNLVSSGTADDIVQLLIATEIGIGNVLSENVMFGRTNEDLVFEKILITIVIHMAEIDACISLMIKRKLMRTVLQLVNPNIEDLKVTWSMAQFRHLSEYGLCALSVLAPKMPKEFIKFNGVHRLSMLLEWAAHAQFDERLVMNCTKTSCSIIINGNSSLVHNLREHGMLVSVMKLINRILDFEKLTMQQQRITTLLLITAERLLKKDEYSQTIYGDQSIRFITNLLNKCLYRKSNDFQIDERLLLAIGSYIWECIVSCQMNLQNFLEHGAIYTILDIIEIASYPIRCLYLGVLTDICDQIFCGPYLCTWRGIDKKTGLMSLLAMIWREEEIRIGVKRLSDGSMEDPELPQMGTKQWLDTYHTKLTSDSSPALTDMIGSIRSKIYSIRKIIDGNDEKYEMAQDRYKVLLEDLSVEDRITMSCVDLYFRLKLGQIWVEIARYFEQVGITPLGMDGQAMFLIIQRHRSWGMFIKERQKRILLSVKNEEGIKEKEEYARIRNAKLPSALDAFSELDYIRRTTDRHYMQRMKNKQRTEVNAALHFPQEFDNAHCHRTFQEKINVTAIFNQHCSIINVPPSESSGTVPKVCPVSPLDSGGVHLESTTSESSIFYDCTL